MTPATPVAATARWQRIFFYTACVYLVLGLGSGAFYREFTKHQEFSEQSFTQLALTHTHLLTLGCVASLLFLILEKVFVLSTQAQRLGWLYGAYNLGVVVTVVPMYVNGIRTVQGLAPAAAVSGIAGLGHIVITVAILIFLLVLHGAITREPAVDGATEDATIAHG